jgi:hypothetical protein
LWPIHRSLEERVDFARIALGILLIILFIGKTFYDTVFSRSDKKPRKPVHDLLVMVGAVTLIALLVGVTMVFIFLFLLSSLQEAGGPG